MFPRAVWCQSRWLHPRRPHPRAGWGQGGLGTLRQWPWAGKAVPGQALGWGPLFSHLPAQAAGAGTGLTWGGGCTSSPLRLHPHPPSNTRVISLAEVLYWSVAKLPRNQKQELVSPRRSGWCFRDRPDKRRQISALLGQTQNLNQTCTGIAKRAFALEILV